MNVLSDSGGLCWGLRRNSQIIILPEPPRPDNPLTVREVEEVVCKPALTWKKTLSQAVQGSRSTHRTNIVGVGEGLRISFSYNGQRPIEALRQIQEDEGDLPAGLTGALYAASEMRVAESKEPYIFAYVCFETYTDQPREHSRKPESDLLDLAGSYIDALATQRRWRGEFPDDPVRLARFYWLVSFELWQLARVGALARIPVNRLPKAVQDLAYARYMLNDPDQWKPQATTDGGKLDAHRDLWTDLWPHLVRLYRWGMPSWVIRFLTHGQISQWSQLSDSLSRGIRQEDLASIRRLAHEFMQASEQGAVFAPAGKFLVDLPANYPLKSWGVSKLRVCVQTRHLWFALVGQTDREVSLSCGWDPDAGLTLPFKAASSSKVLLNVTMAAFWHDLHIAWRETIRDMFSGQGRAEHKTAYGMKKHPTRDIPRGKTISFGSRSRSGGTGNSISFPHFVSGFFRRLPPGQQASDYARANARQYGFWDLPPGCTFVQPHERGGIGDALPVRIERVGSFETIAEMLR